MGPEKTVDGSGLNADDQHSVERKHMWLSAGAQPNWIQFEFDKAYKLHELWVWNSNQLIETIIGFGAKSVKVEYSLDGTAWTELAGRARVRPGDRRRPPTRTTRLSTFGGVLAKYVKLTINSSWGGLAQAGLSEVRFFYVSRCRPAQPEPAAAATGVELRRHAELAAGTRSRVAQGVFRHRCRTP